MQMLRAPLNVVVALATGLALVGCDDGKAAKAAEEKIAKLQGQVLELQSGLSSLTGRLIQLEARAKDDGGPTSEDLGPVIAEIDATAKSPGAFIANYVFISADKEGNGVWRLVFGPKTGIGRRLQTRTLKTATGWVWVKGDMLVIP